MICPICPRRCDIEEGGTGFCKARTCSEGKIVDKNYGRLTALALDPIEKKPLKHFHPGSYILSAGSYGCNLDCPFCQNHGIARTDGSCGTAYYSPEDLVSKAEDLLPKGNIGLAFTYNEPLIGFEYLMDCAALAKKRGLKTVLVTNGTVNPGPLKRLLPRIDAMNIDLKGFTQDFYDLVGGSLETVKETIALSAAVCHAEVTTLVIPGLNDSETDMDAEARFLASISPELPLHISRFFPRYRMADRAPTPAETVYTLRDIAAKHLKYVYTGNC